MRRVHGPPCIGYLYSLPSLLLFFSFIFLLFLHQLLTHSYRMPFTPSPIDVNLLNTPSLPPPDYLTSKLPSFPNQIESTNPFDQMNPYQLIALKARQATKEREAKRKARLLERSSQSSGSGSSGVMRSGESSLGDGSFPRQRSEWDRAAPKSTSVSPSLQSSTPSTESSKTRLERDLNTVEVRNFPTTTNTSTRLSLEQASQISDDPVPSLIPNGMNDMSYDPGTEEEDDDADLKRLMNQAQAMLNISANPLSSESKSPDKGNDQRVLDVEPELNNGKGVGTSVLADPNDEKR
jgi:hypothetical protein